MTSDTQRRLRELSHPLQNTTRKRLACLMMRLVMPRIYSLVSVGMIAVNNEGSREDCEQEGRKRKRSKRNRSPFHRNRRNAYLVNRSPSQKPFYKLTPRYPILEQLQALPLSKTLHRPAARSITYEQPLRLENGSVVCLTVNVIFLLAAEALSCEGVNTPRGDIIEFIDGNACSYALRLHPRRSDSQAYPTFYL
jgi:hypothetical protein